MVNASYQSQKKSRQHGLLMTEMMVGIAILTIAILPLAYSFAQENKYLRRCYERSITMEIVDGEMEILHAGGWRNYTNGTQFIPCSAHSLTNLPPGNLQLTLAGKNLRLEWRPTAAWNGNSVVREVILK